MDVDYLVMVNLSRLLIPEDGCKLSRLLNIFLLGFLKLSNVQGAIELTLTAQHVWGVAVCVSR